ncbi:hypothetical protein NHX12_030361, partial [Muraenolepis orangiensis]
DVWVQGGRVWTAKQLEKESTPVTPYPAAPYRDTSTELTVLVGAERCQQASCLLLVHWHPPLAHCSLPDLLPAALGSYYRYTGSLTTPPCSKVVEWILFSRPLYLSYKQLEAFYSIFTTEQQDHVKSVEYLRSNFRPIQNLDDRHVFKSAVKDAWMPDMMDGGGGSSSPYGTEASKVCSSAPIKMKVRHLNSSALVVRWARPEVTYHPPILHFLVKKLQSFSTSTTKSEHMTGFEGESSPEDLTGFEGESSPEDLTWFEGESSPVDLTGFEGLTGFEDESSPEDLTGFEGESSPVDLIGFEDLTGFEGESSPVDLTVFEGESSPVDLTGFEGESSPVDLIGFEGESSPVDLTGFEGESSPVDLTGFEGESSPVDLTGFEGESSPVDLTWFEGESSPVDLTGFEGESSPVDLTGFEGESSPVDLTGFEANTTRIFEGTRIVKTGMPTVSPASSADMAPISSGSSTWTSSGLPFSFVSMATGIGPSSSGSQATVASVVTSTLLAGLGFSGGVISSFPSSVWPTRAPAAPAGGTARRAASATSTSASTLRTYAEAPGVQDPTAAVAETKDNGEGAEDGETGGREDRGERKGVAVKEPPGATPASTAKEKDRGATAPPAVAEDQAAVRSVAPDSDAEAEDFLLPDDSPLATRVPRPGRNRSHWPFSIHTDRPSLPPHQARPGSVDLGPVEWLAPLAGVSALSLLCLFLLLAVLVYWRRCFQTAHFYVEESSSPRVVPNESIPVIPIPGLPFESLISEDVDT